MLLSEMSEKQCIFDQFIRSWVVTFSIANVKKKKKWHSHCRDKNKN